jgi:hypothetical protein
MLNWSEPIAPGHPLSRKFPLAYPNQVLPEEVVPGITEVLTTFHQAILDVQTRFLADHCRRPWLPPEFFR